LKRTSSTAGGLAFSDGDRQPGFVVGDEPEPVAAWRAASARSSSRRKPQDPAMATARSAVELAEVRSPAKSRAVARPTSARASTNGTYLSCVESFVPAFAMAVGVFVVSVLVLRKVTPASFVRLSGRLPSRPATVFSRDDVRRQADRVLSRLAHELSVTNPAEVDSDLYERAGLARSAAERVLDSARLTDVIGALTLARSGLDDLRVATGRSQARYQPCFFNPLHEQAVKVIDFVIDAGTVSVPSCRRCHGDIRSGVRELDVVPSDTRPGGPYFLGDDMWAVTGYGALVEDLPMALFRYEQARRETTS
jgi:hypothetical protein